MDGFERLKEICRVACHERNACKPGFEALMKTESINGILNVWKANWQDIFDSKFADIMVANIVSVYQEMRSDFVLGGVFVNESTESGLLIVSDAKEKIFAGGSAKVYVFTPSEVEATDNAQVYCRAEGSRIVLRGHSYGYIDAGEVEVRDFAHLQGSFTAHTYNASETVVKSGTVIDHGHRRIVAYGGSRVYSDATRNITLSEQSRQYPLNEYSSHE